MVFAQQKHMAAMEITAYNPTKDPDGSGAKIIIDLLAAVLEKRLETLKAATAAVGAAAVRSEPAPVPDASSVSEQPESVAPEVHTQAAIPPVPPGEPWSSDTLEDTMEPASAEGHAAEDTHGSEEPHA
jgi:hypothetical protein